MKVPFREYSPITAAVAQLLKIAKYLSPMTWLSRRWPELKPRSDITEKEIQNLGWAKRRARAVEWYILATLAVLAIVIGLAQLRTLREGWFHYIIVLVAALKIIEVLQVTMNAVVFDRFSGRPDDQVASTARMVVLAMLNFVEIAACFGLLYSVDLSNLHGAHGTGDAFYFSIITQLTIGYGDIYPVGSLRALAAVHGFLGVGFVVLVVARLVNALPPIEGRFD